MAKLWQKSFSTAELVEEFTVGNDADFDLALAPHDVCGSMAHIRMLNSIGLLEDDELELLLVELKKIYSEILQGHFVIDEGVEDVHSQVEMMLTDRLGDVGKKIHSGRSRNDQVLVDLKLFLREKVQELTEASSALIDKLVAKSEEYKDFLIPGYTHFQVAMPSSMGLWFGAYAESLVDDLHMLNAAFKVANKNPLGSAAGYGSSFPLNRTMTTELLGFEDLNYNVVYAQMSRGKTERIVGTAMASVASSLSRMAMDVCLYMNQNFGFISFPNELTTGSSIMPHKKNPDVFEIIRGRCNRIISVPNEIALLVGNLPSGYHREMQLIKESLFPAIDSLMECIKMADFMFDHIIVKERILEDEKYKYLFSVEVVNDLVLKGVPFRDAYKKVGELIEKGDFVPNTNVKHTHEGSIGNLKNDQIVRMKDEILNSMGFEDVKKKIDRLVNND